MAPSPPVCFACLFVLAWLPCPSPNIASDSCRDQGCTPHPPLASMLPSSSSDQEYQRLKVGMESLLASNEEKVKRYKVFSKIQASTSQC